MRAEVASDTLVALSRNHFSLVMYELQHHLKPLNLTEESVIVTLAKLASGNGRARGHWAPAAARLASPLPLPWCPRPPLPCLPPPALVRLPSGVSAALGLLRCPPCAHPASSLLRPFSRSPSFLLPLCPRSLPRSLPPSLLSPSALRAPRRPRGGQWAAARSPWGPAHEETECPVERARGVPAPRRLRAASVVRLERLCGNRERRPGGRPTPGSSVCSPRPRRGRALASVPPSLPSSPLNPNSRIAFKEQIMSGIQAF